MIPLGGLFILSLPYSLATIVRNKAFDWGLLKTRKLPVPVISIGNITAGGTGKTPMALLIGTLLKESDRPMGLLSRGYGRKSMIPFAIRNSEGFSADQIGDEPKLLGDRLGCPLGIGANRFRQGDLLIRKFGARTLVLDDGFSHRYLERDLNLLLMDGRNPWGSGMLPHGIRRETKSNVRRADAVIITGDKAHAGPEGLREELAKHGFKGPVFTAVREAEGIVTPQGDLRPLSDFTSTPFYLFSGIAGSRFAAFAEAQGLSVKGDIAYSDHFPFDTMEMDKIRENAQGAALLTTEKDFARLGPLAQNIFHLRITLRVEPEAEFRALILKTASVSAS